MVRIVGAQIADVLKQRLGLKGVEPGIDFLNLLLPFFQRFLLDNSLYFIALRGFANDAPVASRVLQPCGQNGHRRILGQVEIANFLDGL